MNEQIKAIRAEIERRMEKHWDLLPDADSPEDDWTHNEFAELGAYKELEHLETFVDSLPEETDNEEPNRPKSSDNPLEEEMEKVGANWPFPASFDGYAKKWVDGLMEECAKHFYELGKKDLKEQMMKDAVECVVYAGKEGGKWIMTYIGSYETMLKTCQTGDKVRIIIVKEEG